MHLSECKVALAHSTRVSNHWDSMQLILSSTLTDVDWSMSIEPRFDSLVPVRTTRHWLVVCKYAECMFTGALEGMGVGCSVNFINIILPSVKTGSPQVLLGGPGGQGTRVEVSPDTSRAWATTEVDPGAYGQSPERRKVVRSLQSISRARTNPWRLGIVQGVLASSLGQTWLSPFVRVWDLLGAGRGPKGTDRVRQENKMD